jgi:hypothetical protein
MPVAIRVAQTPNPNAMKFTLDRQVLEGVGRTFSDPDAPDILPVAKRLLALPGVASVFLVKDFISVSRARGVSWDDLVPAIERALTEHYG